MKIGINTELLNQEQIHTREQTLDILGISPKTLWKYENQNLIKGTRFKSKKYYTSNDIIEFVKSQFNLPEKNTWETMWE